MTPVPVPDPLPPDVRPPSVDRLARSLRDVGLPHPLLVDAARSAIAAGDPASARHRAEDRAAGLLRPVVNATGVLLHTNLGRSPLAGADGIGSGGIGSGGIGSGGIGPARYSNLELNMASGRRGSRSAHAAELLARATGAEAALVVNNGAAAVLLVLAVLAPGAGVTVSRGELVEIGGGFRIPDVLAASGARLVEVGTTNRTRLADYRRALDEGSALVLKVHRSNFTMTGFVESAGVEELATLGSPVVVDLGSGLLDARCPWLPDGPPSWLAAEPGVRQTLAAGADLVTFSGDKLLGGPQAGIVAGREELVRRCAAHPLYRALRPGGLVLAALQATALSYLSSDAASLPFWAMATRSVDELRLRAESLGAGVPTPASSVIGGGALPGVEIPSYGVRVAGDRAADLRRWDPPVIATVAGDGTLCDLRTVDPCDDAVVGAALRACT